ncbi:MAG: D-alanyl-D-alanine carboxypeptidase family protein [Acutalibacteraceae bacterium]
MLSKQNPFIRIAAISAAVIIMLSAAGCSGKDSGEDTSTSSTAPAQSSQTSAPDEQISTSSSTAVTSESSSKTSVSKTKTSSESKTQTSKYEYIYAYAGFNPSPADMSVPFNMILLNRDYVLPDGYTPKLAEAVKGSSVKLDYRVAPHYQEMYDAAKEDGITLTPVSGYRTYTRQKNNFENRIALLQNQGYSKKEATIKASEIILLPGTSEHNAGLAMDICSLSESFENTKESRWLQEHAHEYGFIMRYPKDKTDITKITYEPWHYRYVGVEVAAKIKSSGMVLEEYLGKA